MSARPGGVGPQAYVQVEKSYVSVLVVSLTSTSQAAKTRSNVCIGNREFIVGPWLKFDHDSGIALATCKYTLSLSLMPLRVDASRDYVYRVCVLS
jgi:hypothetical protein